MIVVATAAETVVAVAAAIATIVAATATASLIPKAPSLSMHLTSSTILKQA